jgi:pimeloyl-ACP methyl ester carboxylesterase
MPANNPKERLYGRAPYRIVLVHGGPGVRGELALVGEAMESVDAFCKIPAAEDPASAPLTGEEPDGEAFSRIWPEASVLRKNGLFLEACRSIACPIAVIHGDYDVHPSAGVIEPLELIGKKPSIDLLARCGHKPWVERYAREEFFAVLEKRITGMLPAETAKTPLVEP